MSSSYQQHQHVSPHRISSLSHSGSSLSHSGSSLSHSGSSLSHSGSSLSHSGSSLSHSGSSLSHSGSSLSHSGSANTQPASSWKSSNVTSTISYSTLDSDDNCRAFSSKRSLSRDLSPSLSSSIPPSFYCGHKSPSNRIRINPISKQPEDHEVNDDCRGYQKTKGSLLDWLGRAVGPSPGAEGYQEKTKVIEPRPVSNRLFNILPTPKSTPDFVENYIEGLSDSRRLTLIKYLLTESPSRTDERRWTRRPGRRTPILGDQELMDAYEKCFIEVTKVLSPDERAFVNQVISEDSRTCLDEDMIDELDQCLMILSKAIEKSKRLQQNFQNVAELQSSLIFQGKGLYGPKDIYYYKVSELLAKPQEVIIEPLPVMSTIKSGLALLQPRFAKPIASGDKYPMTERLTHDLLYLISNRYNELWNELQGFSEISISSFVTLFLLLALPSGLVLPRFGSLLLWILHVLVANDRRFTALERACEEVNRVTGRLGVSFHPQPIGVTLGLRSTVTFMKDIIKTKDLFVLKDHSKIKKFQELQRKAVPLPIQPIVAQLPVLRGGRVPEQTIYEPVTTGTKLDDPVLQMAEWRAWLGNPDNEGPSNLINLKISAKAPKSRQANNGWFETIKRLLSGNSGSSIDKDSSFSEDRSSHKSFRKSKTTSGLLSHLFKPWSNSASMSRSNSTIDSSVEVEVDKGQFDRLRDDSSPLNDAILVPISQKGSARSSRERSFQQKNSGTECSNGNLKTFMHTSGVRWSIRRPRQYFQGPFARSLQSSTKAYRNRSEDVSACETRTEIVECDAFRKLNPGSRDQLWGKNPRHHRSQDFCEKRDREKEGKLTNEENELWIKMNRKWQLIPPITGARHNPRIDFTKSFGFRQREKRDSRPAAYNHFYEEEPDKDIEALRDTSTPTYLKIWKMYDSYPCHRESIPYQSTAQMYLDADRDTRDLLEAGIERHVVQQAYEQRHLKHQLYEDIREQGAEAPRALLRPKQKDGRALRRAKVKFGPTCKLYQYASSSAPHEPDLLGVNDPDCTWLLGKNSESCQLLEVYRKKSAVKEGRKTGKTRIQPKESVQWRDLETQDVDIFLEDLQPDKVVMSIRTKPLVKYDSCLLTKDDSCGRFGFEDDLKGTEVEKNKREFLSSASLEGPNRRLLSTSIRFASSQGPPQSVGTLHPLLRSVSVPTFAFEEIPSHSSQELLTRSTSDQFSNRNSSILRTPSNQFRLPSPVILPSLSTGAGYHESSDAPLIYDSPEESECQIEELKALLKELKRGGLNSFQGNR